MEITATIAAGTQMAFTKFSMDSVATEAPTKHAVKNNWHRRMPYVFLMKPTLSLNLCFFYALVCVLSFGNF
jgi:hypothetical protein